MHFTLPILAILATMALAQDQPCVNKCFQENASSSWCDGDETGDDLAACTCQGLNMSPAFPCIRDCPSDEVNSYAAKVPELCRDTLLPDADVSSDAPEPSATETDDSDDSSETATETGASATSDDEPSNTEADASPSETGAAGGLHIPMVMGAGGLIAALLI